MSSSTRKSGHVRAGSFCTLGDSGTTQAGTPMRCTETGDGKRARWRKAAGAVSASRVRKRESRTPRQRAADKLRQSEINYLRNAVGLPYAGALPRNRSQRTKLETAGFIDPDGNITDHGRDALRRRGALGEAAPVPPVLTQDRSATAENSGDDQTKLRRAQDRQAAIDAARAAAAKAASAGAHSHPLTGDPEHAKDSVADDLVRAGMPRVDADTEAARVMDLDDPWDDARALGAEPIGAAGTVARFHPELHEPHGNRPALGAPVFVLRAGVRWAGDQPCVLERAQVVVTDEPVDRSGDAGTDWAACGACATCGAAAGTPCYDLRSPGSLNAHPHDGRPYDGRPTTGPGPAGESGEGPESFRFAGTDRVDDVVQSLAGEDLDYEGRRRVKQDTPYDLELAKVARMQNFDLRPQVGTREEVDKAVADGWTEVWRGVQDSEQKTAADINGDMREGHFQPGRGMYGNGVYTSVRKLTAETFRGREPRGSHPQAGPGPGRDFTDADLDGDASPDSMLRIAIDPAARIVDYNDLIAEQREWIKENHDLQDTAAGVVLRDPGRFAAARGYDGIRVVNRADGSYYPGWKESDDLDGLVEGFDQADQYVVLNRTVMLIQRAEDPA